MKVAKNQKAKIYNRWQEKARQFGSKYSATIQDFYFRKLNTFMVLKYLNFDDRLLDVGCGNGVATAEYAKSAKFTIGIDYLPKFIEIAGKKYQDLVKAGKLEFKVGNILELEKLDLPKFDKVTCERTLINLTTWNDQKRAVENIWKVLKPQGQLLLTEVTVQGHQTLDSFREVVKLPPVEKYWSNLYLDEPKFERYVEKFFKIVEKIRFGTYGLVSKIVHPALVAPREPQFLAKINKIAYEISKHHIGADGPSHTVFYVLKKIKIND